jgi:hypothetical protein
MALLEADEEGRKRAEEGGRAATSVSVRPLVGVNGVSVRVCVFSSSYSSVAIVTAVVSEKRRQQ